MRDALGIETGTKVYFVKWGDGYVLKPSSSSIMRLSGILKGVVPVLTEAEVERRLAQGLAEKFLPEPDGEQAAL